MKRALVLFALTLACGCATAINGRYQEIPVTSRPSGASVTVGCLDEPNRRAGTTPTSIRIRRNAENCVLTFEKGGYEPRRVELTRTESARTAVDTPASLYVGAITAVLAFPFAYHTDDMGVEAEGFKAGANLPFAIDRKLGGAWKQEPERADVWLRPLP